MFEARVTTVFHAAHHLYRYAGECSSLHGHTWKVEVCLAGEQLDRSGMLFDFKEMKGMLEDVTRPYDHDYINQIPPFDELSPTAENLARHIYLTLKKQLRGRAFQIASVTVWESERASATYRE